MSLITLGDKAKTVWMLLLIAVSMTGCDNHSRLDEALNPILIVETDNGLIVPVVIAGQRYRFLLATGSNFTILDRTLAAELARSMAQSDIPEVYRAELSAITNTIGRERVGIIHPLPLQIGKQRLIGEDPWLTLDLSTSEKLMGAKIDGLLGVDTFRRFSWLVDNVDRTLLIAQGKPPLNEYDHCTGYSDAHGSSPTLWLNSAGEPIPLELNTLLDENYITHDAILKLTSIGGRVTTLNAVDSLTATLNPEYWANFRVSGLSIDDWVLGEMHFAKAVDDGQGVGLDFLARFDRYAFLPTDMLFCFDAKSVARRLSAPLEQDREKRASNE